MEAQKGKLFRFGRAIRVLLIVIVIVTGLSALVTFWDALSCVLRPADEVVYVIGAVEMRARERALTNFGACVYNVCTVIAFVFCMGMTRKMSEDKNPFNAENVRLLRKMAWLFGLTAAGSLVTSAAYAVSAGYGAGTAVLSVFIMTALQLVVALLLGFLADVFEYGTELQRLSDETL